MFQNYYNIFGTYSEKHSAKPTPLPVMSNFNSMPALSSRKNVYLVTPTYYSAHQKKMVLRLFVWKLWQSGRIASLGRNDIAPHRAAIR